MILETLTLQANFQYWKRSKVCWINPFNRCLLSLLIFICICICVNWLRFLSAESQKWRYFGWRKEIITTISFAHRIGSQTVTAFFKEINLGCTWKICHSPLSKVQSTFCRICYSYCGHNKSEKNMNQNIFKAVTDELNLHFIYQNCNVCLCNHFEQFKYKTKNVMK